MILKFSNDRNFFQICFKKFQNIRNPFIEAYVNLVSAHSFKLISTYLIIMFLLSLGLFQAQFDTDANAMAIIRNSPSMRNAKILNDTFGFNQYGAHFNNKLYDLGCYFEIIVNFNDGKDFKEQVLDNEFLKPQYNLINRTLLNDFNELYDEIMAIEIEYLETDASNETKLKNFTYKNDLCARRFDYCSVEGGLIRNENFQKKFLKHDISIMENDIKQTYVDSDESDAVNIPLSFGEYVKYEKRQNQLAITHTSAIRIRFDLLASTEYEKALSNKYMDAFINLMNKLKKDSRFKNLKISYFTTHSLDTEIKKYSILDKNYVILCFLVFWVLLCVCFILTTSSHKSSNDLVIFGFSLNWIRLYIIVILIVLTVFLQVILSLLSAFGTLSLFGIEANLLTTTILFIVTIVGSHQAYLIFSSINYFNRSKKHLQIENTLNTQEPFDIELASIDKVQLEKSQKIIILQEVAHQYLVPIFFSTFASIVSYSAIGFVDGFDSIRTYCLFTNVCLSINLFGQILFFYPICSVYLKEIDVSFPRNESNSTNITPSTQEFESHHGSISTQEPRSEDNITSSIKDTKDMKKISQAFNWIGKKYERFSLFNLTFRSKLRYFVLIGFIAYTIFNICLCVTYLKVNIPILDLIPNQSFLKEHMTNHMTLFKLGPIITIAFLKPLEYWNKETFDLIVKFSSETRKLDKMHHNLEISWLNDLYANAKLKGDFYDNCKTPIHTSCFAETFNETTQFAFFIDDVVTRPNSGSEPNFEISASRFYIQMESFTGTHEESELMHNIQQNINENVKFWNLTSDDVIAFSPIYIFLEQIDEIIASFLTLCVLSFESIFILTFFLIFDLRSLMILLVINVSLVISIMGNLLIFKISLNIATLYHFLLLPALLSEFFIYIAYIFLLGLPSNRSEYENNSSASRNELKSLTKRLVLDSENSPPVPELIGTFSTYDLRLENLRTIHSQCINRSCNYLLNVAMFGFGFMYFCSTYNFYTLFIFLMTFCFNVCLHLFFFYPVLLLFIGTSWTKI